MRMKQAHVERLEALCKPECSTDLVRGLLGIEFPGDEPLALAFRTWARGFFPTPDVLATERVNRYALETFLQENKLVSWKWAAVDLGMLPATMKTVVSRLESKGVPTQVRFDVSEQLVRQRESSLLYRAFPSLRHRVFSSHTQACRALHEAIHTELEIDVEPVHCVTSRLLDAADPDLAAAFDTITGDPVGLRYQVWLDTHKPVHLRPDVCSSLFYARNEADLRDRVMKGSAPAEVDKRLLAA